MNFLISEDAHNPIRGLGAIHHTRLQAHLHGKGKCIRQQDQHRALLNYHQSHYYASGLVLSDHAPNHHLRWSDPQYTILDRQSASKIIAEIDDDKIGSGSRQLLLGKELRRIFPSKFKFLKVSKFQLRPVQQKENLMNSQKGKRASL